VAAPRRALLILTAMSVMSALIWMPTSAVPVALPAIHDDLGSPLSDLQWMINAYTLAVAALLVVMGRTGDLIGRRRVFLIGCVVFSLGGLSASLAESSGFLIGSVAVLGVGAALAGPASLALIVDAFPPERQGRAIGIWGAASGLGTSLGPMIGGLLIQGIGWQAVFWSNVPFALFAAFLAARYCGESRSDEAKASIDLPGAMSFGAGLTALILAVGQGSIWGWGSLPVIALFAAAVILLVSFVAIDLRVRSPLIPLREFAVRAFVISEVVLLLGNIVLVSLFFILPLYLQNIQDHTALAAGAILLPATLTLLVLSPVSGAITDRVGPRVPMVAGILVSALGVYLLSTIGPGADTDELMPGLIVIGIGFGLEITPINVAAVQAVPVMRRATASGVLLTTGMVGATIGIALFVAVFGSMARDDLPGNLAKVGVSVSSDNTDKLDTVVTGSERAQDALGDFPAAQDAKIEDAIEESFVSALTNALKGLAGVQLLAALFALGLPGRTRESAVGIAEAAPRAP
jgi:EmrB/QacA subfamily drug resistance transporter